MDIVLGAAENDIAKRFAPAIVKAGAVFVDNSSAFRLDPDVPLVIPEINPGGRQEASRASSPTPTAPPSCRLVAINALNQDSPIEMHRRLARYQATSGAGAGGPIELMNEVEAAAARAKPVRAEGVPVSDRLQRHPADRRRGL